MFKWIDKWKKDVNVYGSMDQILRYAPFKDKIYFRQNYLAKDKEIPFPIKGIYSKWDRFMELLWDHFGWKDGVASLLIFMLACYILIQIWLD